MVTVEQPEVVSSLLVDWLSDIERGRSAPDC
jgi:hypothetical protein